MTTTATGFQIVGEVYQVTAIANNANTQALIPAGMIISRIGMVETSNQTVTGGINIGTTPGAADVVSAFAVAAGTINAVPDASLLKKAFSAASIGGDQMLNISPVTSWNAAVVTIRFFLLNMNDCLHF